CLVLTPKRISRAFSAFGLNSPWNFDIMASAGFPGISRGSRKLRVSATHSVRTKKPSRRSAYLKLVGSGEGGWGGGGGGLAGPRARDLPRSLARGALTHFGDRCSSTCSLSGYWYADGWAYGLLGVGQPLKVPVSYWYQSTDSVTGMIGTELSMTCWI